MNKKFSTLMAISLMALSTSAFAADVLPLASSPAQKVEGKKYFLVQNVTTGEGATTGLDAADKALGMRIDPDTKELYYDAAAYSNGKFSTADQFDVNNYLREVTQSTVEGNGSKYYYSFKNVATGELLRVPNTTVAAGETVAFEDKVEDTDNYKNGLTSFILNSSSNQYLKYEGGTDATFYLKGKYEKSTPVNAVLTFYDGGGVYGGTVSNQCIQLYEATDQEVSDGALNSLYNAVGFNYDLKKGYETVDNSILNGGNAIYAIKLANDVNVTNENTKFGFPAGTYLAVETPAYDYDNSWDAADKLDYLLNSTFVAVSLTDNASNKADNQNKGEGF